MTARPRLSRNVVILSWVSFFQDAASEMLYPVLPLFITGVLGAPPVVVGLIEGVAEGLSSVMKGISGRLADRFARRPLVAAGYGLSSVAKALIAFAAGWPFLLVCRVLDRVGKGLRTSPRDALIASDTPPAMRGRAFGFHRALDTAGAVVGPLIGLGLYEALQHQLRPLFLIAFLPALASVALVAIVREGPLPGKTAEPAAKGPLPRAYWRVVVFLTIFGLANFSDALIILRVKQLGFGFAAIMVAYALYNASYALLSYPAGVIADRVTPPLVFAVGLGVFAIAYLGFGFAQASWWAWLLLPFYGAYTALTDGVGKSWIAGLVLARSVGSGLGLYQGITGAASLVAGVWAGLAWGGTGTLPFLVSGTIVALLALILVLTSLGRCSRPTLLAPRRE